MPCGLVFASNATITTIENSESGTCFLAGLAGDLSRSRYLYDPRIGRHGYYLSAEKSLFLHWIPPEC